jgi:hypothetical protein
MGRQQRPGDLYQQAQAIREQAAGLAPDPEIERREREKANFNAFYGSGLQTLGGSRLGATGGAVLRQALGRQSELEMDPKDELRRRALTAEAQARGLEQQAETMIRAEDRAAAREQAAQAREEANNLRRELHGESIAARREMAAAVAGARGERNTDRLDQQKFTRAAALRNDFDPLVKNERITLQTYPQIEAALSGNPSPASDMRAIFRYMKMLDPTSVVREGEYATAAQARGVPDAVLNSYNRAIKGEKLTPKQRADFLAQAKSERDVAQRVFNERAGQFSELARRAGIDPQDVIMGAVQPDAAPSVPRFERRGAAGKTGDDGVVQLPY